MSSFPTECIGAQSATLWLVDGRRVRDKTLEHGKSQLAPLEIQRFAGFQRAERQRQYLLGRMLLRHAISRVTSLPSAAIKVADRPGFSPLLILPEGVPRPGFSLSHSRHWIGCVTGFDAVLGLDIEVIDPKRDIIALSEAGFHADEHAWLLRRTGTERVTALYRLWTLKEALFKLWSNSGERREIPPVVDCSGELLLHGEGWFSSGFTHPELSITVCSSRALRDIAWVEPSELMGHLAMG